MTPRHDDSDHDLHDPLLRRLYRELPDEAPSADTDARVRAAARRAVGAGPRRRGTFFGARWETLGASAAALMLGVALTVQWRVQEPEQLEEAITVAPAAGARSPASRTSASPAKSAAASDDARPAAADDAMTADRPTMKAKAVPAEPMQEAAPPATAAPAPRREAFAKEESGSLPEADSAREAKSVAPAAREEGGEVAIAPVAGMAAGSLSANAGRNALAEREDRAPAAAPAAPAAAPDLAEYREAMVRGDFNAALTALPVVATTPVMLVDRDLLRQWQAPGSVPTCTRMTRSWLGAQALLCDILREFTARQALPADWRTRLDAAGLNRGEFAYRRLLLETLAAPR